MPYTLWVWQLPRKLTIEESIKTDYKLSHVRPILIGGVL